MNFPRLLVLTSALGASSALGQSAPPPPVKAAPKPAAAAPAGVAPAPVAATPAAAPVPEGTPRVTVLPFKGLKTAAAVQKQLADILCARAACIDLPKPVAKGQPKPPNPDFVLAGQLSAKKGQPAQLLLTLTPSLQPGKPPAPPVYKQSVNLTADQSGVEDADKVSEALEVSMGFPRPPPPPPPPPPPAPEPEPVKEEPPPPPVVEKKVEYPPMVVAQVGVEAITRNWGYAGLKISNLRGYRAALVPMPAVHLELYPLARTGNAALAGLGVEGGYATSVGLTSSPANGPAYPTSISRIDAGLRYRAPALVDGKLTLTAFGGYRIEGFKVSAAKDGSTLVGLPNPTYSSVRAGAGASFRFGMVSAFLEAAALPVLGTGDLQKAYFPKTSGLGLEGQLGADIAFTPLLGLRVAGHLTRYALAFKTVDTDPYIASSAVDLYAGGTVALRVTY